MMDPEEPSIRESLKDKSGPELFRELLRLLPLVVLEDYYKNGVWQNDLMKMDIEIIDAHRKEAGAPDPIPIDEVKMPAIPAQVSMASMTSMIRALAANAPTAVTPGAVSTEVNGVVSTSSSSTAPVGEAPAPVGAPVVAPVVTPMAPTLATVLPPGPIASSPVLGAPALDMRVIALFVSKWKLDAGRCKTALEKLTPARRRYVMQNFKYVPVAGATSIAKLEQYISECEKTGSWDPAGTDSSNGHVAVTAPAVSPPPPPAAVTEAASTTQAKRPLETTTEAEEPAQKRPNTNTAPPSKAAAAAARAAAKAAAVANGSPAAKTK
jgi:hypothetical protein